MIHSSPASAIEQYAALQLLFQHIPEDERALQIRELQAQAVRNEFSLDALMLARSDLTGEPCGAMLSVLQDDGTLMMFPPVIRGSQYAEITTSLLQTTSLWFEASSGKLAQCLVEEEDRDFSALLTANGYPVQAELAFLCRELSDLPPRMTESPLTTIPYSPGEHAHFVRTLGATYIDSLDCPPLSRIRSPEEALKGHRLAGHFSADRWNLFQYQDQTAGLLLMAEHPESLLWEIVYVGLVPEFRKRGLAAQMILHGLHSARSAGMRGVMLAVDAANTPALKLYARLHFTESATKRAHLRWKNATAAQ